MKVTDAGTAGWESTSIFAVLVTLFRPLVDLFRVFASIGSYVRDVFLLILYSSKSGPCAAIRLLRRALIRNRTSSFSVVNPIIERW